MRRALLLAGLLLTACKSEPSFNEAYDAQSQELGDKANGIEVELGEQLNASTGAGGLPTNPNAPEPLGDQASRP